MQQWNNSFLVGYDSSLSLGKSVRGVKECHVYGAYLDQIKKVSSVSAIIDVRPEQSLEKQWVD